MIFKTILSAILLSSLVSYAAVTPGGGAAQTPGIQTITSTGSGSGGNGGNATNITVIASNGVSLYNPLTGTFVLTGGPYTNVSLYNTTAVQVVTFLNTATNGFEYVTNETVLTATDTNTLIVTLAGTVASRGTYTQKSYAAGVTVWTNANGQYGIVHDPSALDQHSLTNAAGTQFYYLDQDTLPGIWGTTGGTAPAPTVVYGNVTNTLASLAVTYVRPTMSRIDTNLYVNPYIGDDNFAIRGRPDRPWQTLEGVVLALTTNETIYLAPGTYTLSAGASGIAFPAGTKLIGAGKRITNIRKAGGATDDPLSFSSRSYASGFSSDYIIKVGALNGAVQTNLIFRDIEAFGVIDGVILNAWGDVKFYGCDFGSTVDCIADLQSVRGNTNGACDVFDCNLQGWNRDSTGVHGIIGGSGIIRMFGGSIRVRDGAGGDTICVNARVSAPAGGRVELSGVNLDYSTTNGTALAIKDSNSGLGTVIVRGMLVQKSGISGACLVEGNYATNLIADLFIGNGDSITNIRGDQLKLTAGSNMTFTTNGATHVVTLASSGGGGSQTPWTADIDGGGFKLTNVGLTSVSGLTNTGLTATTIVGLDGNKKQKSVALSGLTYDGTTLTATAGTNYWTINSNDNTLTNNLGPVVFGDALTYFGKSKLNYIDGTIGTFNFANGALTGAGGAINFNNKVNVDGTDGHVDWGTSTGHLNTDGSATTTKLLTTAAGATIASSNTFQIDTPQRVKALEVDTNGNDYFSGTMTVPTANVTTLVLANAVTNFISSGFRDTNAATAKTTIITNGTLVQDGNMTLWGDPFFILQHATRGAGADGATLAASVSGGMAFSKSFTAYVNVGDPTVSPIWGFNPFIAIRDGSGIGWAAVAGGTASTAFIKATTGTITMSNNIVITGNIAATNGFASFRSNALASAAITFPNTTVSWTNTTANTASPAMNIVLYIDNSGVTGTATLKNGQQIFSSLVGDVTLMLKPGDYFSETYTVGTPTARWEPQ